MGIEEGDSFRRLMENEKRRLSGGCNIIKMRTWRRRSLFYTLVFCGGGCVLPLRCVSKVQIPVVVALGQSTFWRLGTYLLLLPVFVPL
jgi:hypothetical protein